MFFFETDIISKSDNKIRFKDECNEDTIMEIEFQGNDTILIKRIGKLLLKLPLKLNKRTSCWYKDDVGVFFTFDVLCTKIIKKNNEIIIEYNNYIAENQHTKHKLWIIVD